MTQLREGLRKARHRVAGQSPSVATSVTDARRIDRDIEARSLHTLLWEPYDTDAASTTQPLAMDASGDHDSGAASIGHSQLIVAEAGRPISPPLRQKLESRFHRDFSHVRIHQGPRAARLTQEMGKLAVTHGPSVFLHPRVDSSDTALIAHELTHVVQQGAAARPSPRLAAAVAPRSTQTGAGAPVAAPRASAPAAQGFSVWGALKRVGGAVVRGVRRAGGAVASVAENVMELGRDALLAIVRRVAPSLVPLLEDGGLARFFRRMLSRGFEALFGGALDRIRSLLRFGSGLGARFAEVASGFATIAAQLARNDCSGILAVAQSVGRFFADVFSPVIDRIRSFTAPIAEFFSGLRDSIAVPVMGFLRRVGGSLWQSVRGFISDIGDMIGRAKRALGRGWTRVKGWLGIEAETGTDEGGGLWNWIRDRVSGLWDSVRETLQPVMGPLRTVGAVLLVLSPAGPVILVIQAWPHLRRAFEWVRQQWSDLNLVVRARRDLSQTVLPTIVEGANRIGAGLVAGADWLLGLLGRVSDSLSEAAQGLGGGLLAPLGRLVQFVMSKVRLLVEWARGGLRQASVDAVRLFGRLRDFLQPIITVLGRLLAIAVNPFGIPGLLLGTLWRLIPDCLKGPIIDFILTVLVRILRVLPAFIPPLGLLWPLIKSAMLGFLERVRSFATERKVRVSTKVATIISGGSVTFALGYLRGLALGLWEAVIGPFQAIADLFRLPGMIRDFLQRLEIDFDELRNQIRTILGQVTERAAGTVETLIDGARDLLANPARIIDLLRQGFEAALRSVRSLAGTLAERLFAILEGPEGRIGEALGNVTGQVLLEAVLAYFTAGGSTALSVIRRVVGFLGRAARNVMRVLRQVAALIPRFLGFLRRIGRGFRAARSRAGGMLQRIVNMFQRVVDWFRSLMRRLRRRRGGRPDRTGPGRRPRDRTPDRDRRRDRRRGPRRDRDRDRDRDRRRRRDRDERDNQAVRWRRFVSRVRALSRRSERNNNGVTRTRLRSQLQRLRARFARAVASVALRSRPKRNEPKWEARVRRRGRPLSRTFEFLVDHRTRWNLGRDAVRRALRPFRRRQPSEDAIERRIRPLRSRYRYSQLRVRYDESETDFDVIGSMSPSNEEIASVPVKPPTENEFQVINPGQSAVVDPLVERTAYSAPSVGWPLWNAIQRIRSRSGRSSLYIRGHLISGHLSGPGYVAGNMTPLSRRANSLMLSQVEREVKRKAAEAKTHNAPIHSGSAPNRRAKVYRYIVRTFGRATTAAQDRYIPGTGWTQVPEERQLARGISMVLTRKTYNASQRRWLRGRRIASARTPNVPPYPEGYKE